MMNTNKVKIRPPKRNLLDQVDTEKAWEILINSIKEIMYSMTHSPTSSNSVTSRLSFEQLYRNCYHIVLRKQGEKLYNEVNSIFVEFLKVRNIELLKFVQKEYGNGLGNDTIDINFIKGYNSAIMDKMILECENYSLCLSMVSDILMYLDRVYVKEAALNNHNGSNNSQILAVYDLGMKLFKIHMLDANNIGNVINTLILNGINQIRNANFYSIKRDDTDNEIQKQDMYLNEKFQIKAIIKMYGLLYSSDNYINNSNSKRNESSVSQVSELFSIENGDTNDNLILSEKDNEENANSNDHTNLVVDSTFDNYYSNHFEPYFLEITYKFYETISSKLINLKDLRIYILKVNDVISFESDLLKFLKFSNVTIYKKTLPLINVLIINNNIENLLKWDLQNDEIIEESFYSWLVNINVENLKLLYFLILKIDRHLKILSKYLRLFIIEKGSSIANDTKIEISRMSSTTNSKKNQKDQMDKYAILYIQKILKFKNGFDLISSGSFQKDSNLNKTIENSFIEFLNIGNDSSKICEYLSLFIDNKLKKNKLSSSSSSSSTFYNDNLETLTKAITIFKYIKDKDLFEKYYQKHLTRRLLNNKSISIDLEKLVVNLIKDEMGGDYTSKLEGMFTDIKISSDLSKDFNSFMELQKNDNNDNKRINFEINVLNTIYWPLQVPESDNIINLPKNLNQLYEEFNKFYTTRHKRRMLTFSMNLFSTLDIKVRNFGKNPSKVYEINLSLYCGLVLLLFEYPEFSQYGLKHESFEENPVFTLEQIQEITSIPESDLIRALQSLSVANPKTRLLKKDPMTKSVNSGDRFQINKSFESSVSKFKVLTVASSSKPETSQEALATLKEVNNARKLEIDACIVRIMKSKKQMLFNSLIAQVIELLNRRFKPSVSFIKERIENLLEREYLARDESDVHLYHYLA